MNETNEKAELIRVALEFAKELKKSDSYIDRRNGDDIMSEAMKALIRELKK